MDNSAESSKMENATPRRRNLRPVLFVAVPVLVIAGIVVAIFMNKKPAESPKNDQPETTKTEEKKEEKEEDKPEEKKEETPAEKKEEEPEIIDGKTPKNLDGGTTEAQNSLTGVINYADVIEDELVIRVSIDQYLEVGTCVLELAAPAVNDVFSLTDQIVPSAATSSCSFNIATSLLTGGHYNIKVTVNSENKTGVMEDEVDV